MTSIALLGATGNIGGAVLDEALARGHELTAVTRDPGKLQKREKLSVRQGSTQEASALAPILRGHDIVVVSVKWNENEINQVIDTIRRSGVKRVLFVIGAGSLLRSDGRTHYDVTSAIRPPPPTSLPALKAFEAIKSIDDLEWTAISPSASIGPGERTRRFRLGLDHLIEDEKGESKISWPDFAVAIVDEIENPQYIRRRFTAGY